MKEYIVWWNAGYGECYELVEASSEDIAEARAYEGWREEAESNADYGVIEASEENKIDYL